MFSIGHVLVLAAGPAGAHSEVGDQDRKDEAGQDTPHCYRHRVRPRWRGLGGLTHPREPGALA